MARGVAMEFKGKRDGRALAPDVDVVHDARQPARPAAASASAWAICSAGLPINSSHDFTGNFFNLLTGYGLWTGVTLARRSACCTARRS